MNVQNQSEEQKSLEVSHWLRVATLGETRGVREIGTLASADEACCALARQARRQMLIYCNRLNRDWFDQHCFLEAAKNLATRHPSTRLLVLLADVEELRINGSRLLELSFRLSSSIEFRKRPETSLGDLRAYMIVDDAGLMMQPIWSDHRNLRLSFSDRPEVRKLEAEFMQEWDFSEPDPSLRQLHI